MGRPKVIDRATLERHQVWAYLAAIGCGLALGTAAPGLAPAFETALWPVLGLLLYATFTQVPLVHLGDALRDGRFVAAVLGGNFVAVPLLVASLLPLVPSDPAVRLGVVLVLVVPCTDWFITFTHLARGETARAIAVTPLVLLAQLLLLPLYVWLLVGGGVTAEVALGHVALAFGALIVTPLALAWLTERYAERAGGALIAHLAWTPVPLLAAVVFLIAGSQVAAVTRALPLLAEVTVAFVLYLAGTLALGVGLARATGLSARAGRTLTFSLGTRNSFVVLPLALALPPSWQAAAIVIVVQSLVELFGMLAFLRLVPRLLPER
jgi:ACR3 family arsenite efflux pump ArsB